MKFSGNINKREGTPPWVIFISILLTAGIFLLDLSLPLGVAACMLYVLLVLLSLWSPQKRYPLFMATLGLLLTFLGFFFSPVGGEMWKALFNRFIALFVIWVTALVFLLHRRADENFQNKTKEELSNAKERADSANRSKDDFFAKISHELRAPMHGILSFAEFGKEDLKAGRHADLLDHFSEIEKSANRLKVLLDDLLDLKKLESGKMIYKMEENDLRKVVDLTISSLNSLIKEKNIVIDILESSIPTIAIFDNMRISQVVSNLLSNALKFSSKDDKITISFQSTTVPGGRRKTDRRPAPGIAFLIANNGPCIPEAELETIFSRYMQSSSTKSGREGTGLGLAICKEIITHHRGEIWAENNQGKGAQFIFTLPGQNEVKI